MVGKGKNPASHGNRSIEGSRQVIKLPNTLRDFAALVGVGNISEGVREIIRCVRIRSNNYVVQAALTLDCKPDLNEIKQLLEILFPTINDGNKTIEDLISEIVLGECSLHRTESGDIYREVRIVSVDIECPIDDGRWLYELRTEYPEGRVIKRGLRGISEKIQESESAFVAAHRAAVEEIQCAVKNLQFHYEEVVPGNKSAYLGLPSKVRMFQFSGTISLEDFKTEYREVQSKKTTVFGWE